MKRFKIFLLTIAFVVFPFHLLHGGAERSRIVGEIADSYLSNKARKAIRKILGDESIAITSNWRTLLNLTLHLLFKYRII
jgi:hypothetical protein